MALPGHRQTMEQELKETQQVTEKVSHHLLLFLNEDPPLTENKEMQTTVDSLFGQQQGHLQ